MFKFLATVNDGAQDALNSGIQEAFKQFQGIFNIIMPILIAVVLMFGLVYGILLGVKFAKAEDTDQRDKAKGQLINLIIGVLVAAVLMVLIYALLPTIVNNSCFKFEASI